MSHKSTFPDFAAAREVSEDELWARYFADGSIENRNALIEKYLHLINAPVRSIYPVCRNTNELSDIFQSAVIGLIGAVEAYSPDCGASFKTFSRQRIHGSVIDYLRKTSLMPVPYHTRRKLQENAGADFDMASHLPQIMSLTELSGDSENGDYISNLLVDLSPSVEEIVTGSIISEEIAGAIDRLPIEEYSVVALYYFKNRTLDEIAGELSVSRTKVWQLRGKAIAKIRKALKLDI